MAIKDQIGQIESKSEPSSGKHFEHYAGPTYQGISEYTKEERNQSVQDSARFASDGVVGNLHLVQADQQPQQQQQQQSEYRPTPRQLRDAIAKRGAKANLQCQIVTGARSRPRLHQLKILAAWIWRRRSQRRK